MRMRNNGLNPSRAYFIVLEGIDGCGSTTQGERVASWLRNGSMDVLLTHQPSSGPAGMLIRLALSKRLMGPNDEFHDPKESIGGERKSLDPHTLALLYAADRMDHLSTEINPSLERNRSVVCDRYVLSTLAYQGMFVDEDWLVDINRFARTPDLTVYIDVPVEHSRHRMRSTRWRRDLFESEDQLRGIRARYLRLIKERHELLGPIIVVNGSDSVDAVAKRIREAIEVLF